jgi:two-component system CitB family sensor kinase
MRVPCVLRISRTPSRSLPRATMSSPEVPMRFATRMLVVQIATQIAVVAVCTAVFAWLGVQQLKAEADSSALNIARAVAEAPEVRDLVAQYSADPGTPDAASLRDGALQHYAADVTQRTRGLFVVITDEHGIRLAHPDPDRLGQVVSTSFADALAGREVVTWETGTLGESARAKVPVYAPDGGVPVGEVSVGFERASVFDDLPALVGGIAVAVALAVAIGALVALLMRRRLERLTLGVQPEELVALVQTQTAVLEGADEGVLAIDETGVVRVCTATAERLLGITDAVGRPLADLDLPSAVATALAGDGASTGLPIGGRVVFIDVRPVRRGARALGRVAVLRDRTDVAALSGRLDSVRAMGDALRVQRHENANRLHAAVGLLDAGRADEARAFLADLVDRGSVDWAVPGIDLVGDAMLQSFLGAKALAARERGVVLRVSDDTYLRGTVDDVEDVVAVLGNLVDNAVTATASGPEPREVEVAVLGDGDAVVLTVADTGGGIADVDAAFAPRERDDDPSAVHGLGIGLPLSREFARRRGGDVWVVDPGGDGHGAVVAARLPGVLRGENE